MMDRRLNPKTTSSSFQVPSSSGPRWRMHGRAWATGSTNRGASPSAVRIPRSPHMSCRGHLHIDRGGGRPRGTTARYRVHTTSRGPRYCQSSLWNRSRAAVGPREDCSGCPAGADVPTAPFCGGRSSARWADSWSVLRRGTRHETTRTCVQLPRAQPRKFNPGSSTPEVQPREFNPGSSTPE